MCLFPLMWCLQPSSNGLQLTNLELHIGHASATVAAPHPASVLHALPKRRPVGQVEHHMHRCPVGCLPRKIDGDSWFTWWFNQLPGPSISLKGHLWSHVPASDSIPLYVWNQMACRQFWQPLWRDGSQQVRCFGRLPCTKPRKIETIERFGL